MNEREIKKNKRILFVLDKIALELDQTSLSKESIVYWTQSPVEYIAEGLNNNPFVPNPREEQQIIQKLYEEGLLHIISNYGEYE